MPASRPWRTSWSAPGGRSAASIRLDQAALEQWDDDELGRHIGFLPQYPSLFAGTCAENIARMGEPDPEAVVAAAQLAGAHETDPAPAARLRHPWWASAVRLSGGEQQRVALARALYGDPALVVLDEPDAHADALAAQLLQRAILALRQRGPTVVVITHQLAPLRVVDRLLMLRDGEVAAFGPRDEVEAASPPAAPTWCRCRASAAGGWQARDRLGRRLRGEAS